MRMNNLMLFVLCLLALLTAACRDSGPSSAKTSPGLNVAEVLGSEDHDGFARATRPRSFDFPRDHGPHPAFKTEWWYYTGNLHNGDGRRFGYQLTFFRNALQPESTPRQSAWASNQIYLAHFALSDPHNDNFYYSERFSREGLGLAGATAEPFLVWLEDWSARGTGNAALP